MSTFKSWLALGLAVLLCVAWLQIDSLQTELSASQTTAAEKTREAADLRSTLEHSQQLQAELEQLDEANTKELHDAQSENQRLRADIADGRKRLQLNATCPAHVPTATSATSVADAGTAELTADARQAYYALRDELALTKQMVLGLQAYARNVCQSAPVKDLKQ